MCNASSPLIVLKRDFSFVEMLLSLNLVEMFGNMNIHGQQQFVHVVTIPNNVRIVFQLLFGGLFLGCFAFFCPCCYECKLYKRAGESMWTCFCPNGRFALRSKIRTAFRIEVMRE